MQHWLQNRVEDSKEKQKAEEMENPHILVTQYLLKLLPVII